MEYLNLSFFPANAALVAFHKTVAQAVAVMPCPLALGHINCLCSLLSIALCILGETEWIVLS
jgi:hypothetical protein